jgi:hypothetical protein
LEIRKDNVNSIIPEALNRPGHVVGFDYRVAFLFQIAGKDAALRGFIIDKKNIHREGGPLLFHKDHLQPNEHKECAEDFSKNIAALEGGQENFTRTILNASPFIFTGSRWDTDVMQFREKARIDILKMIEEGKNTAPKGAKKEKKIQGGC